MPVPAAAPPVPRCCRCGCGPAESAAWIPLYRHQLAVCSACYSEAIRGTLHLDSPVFPVPV
jgi:hypothetical protein